MPPSDISHQPTYIWLLISSYTILPQIQEIFAIRSKLNKIDQNRFVPSTQSLTIAQKKSTLLTKNARFKNNLVRHFSQKLEFITKITLDPPFSRREIT